MVVKFLVNNKEKEISEFIYFFLKQSYYLKEDYWQKYIIQRQYYYDIRNKFKKYDKNIKKEKNHFVDGRFFIDEDKYYIEKYIGINWNLIFLYVNDCNLEDTENEFNALDRRPFLIELFNNFQEMLVNCLNKIEEGIILYEKKKINESIENVDDSKNNRKRL